VTDDNPQSPVHEGDTIAGKYVVERILGFGGMGVVVAARHIELGELFALKFLLPNVGANAEVTRRFAREARTGIRVKNEHVARVLDVGTLPDGAPYMVMEHLTGEDLAALMERRGFLPVAEAVDLLLQACEALCEAHQIGIVHRDLKPANLFVVAGSDGLPFVKVLDFGISKHVGAGDDLSTTAGETILGSPLYMSPEQLRSSRDVDRRSDIWSLGVILYEAVTGATPFEGSSFAALCVSIMTGKYAPASSLRPGIPPALDAILASALQIERDQRLASVELLARQLAPLGTAQARTSAERIARIAARGAPSSGRLPEPSSPSLPDTTETMAYLPEKGAASPPSSTAQPEVAESPKVAAAPPPSPPRRAGATLGLLAVGMGTVGFVAAWAFLRGGPAPRPVPSATVDVRDPVPSASTPITVASAAPSTPPEPPPSSSAAPSASAAASASQAESSAPAASAAREHAPPAPSKPPTGNAAIVALTQAFKRRQSDVSRCVQAAADPPAVPISIRFTVGVDGHVKAAQVLPAEVGASPLGQCLAGVAQSTEFPALAEEVSFRIPIATRQGS
jgi:serine/threonine-protein kinase